jgi:DNA repair exonuclease SbcCD nuclease subunit
MKYEGIVISDIHFGVIDSSELKKELMEVFVYYIRNLKKLDFIIITGDYFDHKIYLNDRTSDYALSFMDLLVSIAKEYHCPIRCVYGTESHEVNQYNIFSVYENNEEIDFKVIYTAQEEELLQGLHVLYLPEEFIFNKKEYYADFFQNEKKYDYIFGHGVIQEVMTNAVRNIKEKESTRKKVPYFTSSELLKMCKGQVYFGHYHINTNIGDKIFYVGSYTRWQHGEEEPKGFYHISCNIEKEKYTQKFIENTLAPKYTEFIYGYSDSVMNSEEDLLKELERVDRLIEAKNSDYVKFTFNIPENHKNPEFIINLLNERYKFNDSVKVKVVNGYVEKKKKINKEKLNNVMSEYPMIFDKNATLENKIIYFIKKRMNKDISEENVKFYLYGNNEMES